MFDDPTPQSTALSARRVARRAAPVLAALSIAIAAPLATSEIVVKRGQTLSGIAKDEHVTVARLAAFNGIANPNLIIEGQVLQIPPPEGAELTYEIAPGDTLGQVARRYGTTVDAIAKRNDLTNVDRIVAGRSLVIPARAQSSAAASAPAAPTTAAPTVTPAAAPTTAAPPTTAPPTTAPPTTAPPVTAAPVTTAAPATTAPPVTTVAPPPASPGVVVSTIWVVQPGDTITSVAARFGLTPGALAAANRVSVGAALTPGQYLFVPQR